jgi:hypothetical protein
LPEAPVLTLPPAEAGALREAYRGAGAILEYGSGGSTVVAAGLPGRVVFSVESDRKWVRMMKGWFAENPPAASVHMHWVDIGRVKAWGVPKGDEAFRQWPDYPLSVWDRPDFVQPDVVLIDGRFRLGCFVATLLRLTRPAVVLFDDYVPRKRYRVAEEFAAPVARIGRMARFEVAPMRLDAADLRRVIGLMLDPG